MDVFLAVPTYNNSLHSLAHMGIMHASRQHTMHCAVLSCSLLAHGFNQLWASAVISKCEWFAMLHADIGPSAHWVDALIEEAEAHEADVMSALSPIKSSQNEYSTALLQRDLNADPRRLHVSHIESLPDTFDASDIRAVMGSPTGMMGVNTGCWVARLKQPWNKQVHFEIKSWIDWEPEGPICRVSPEDWGFSRQAHDLGIRLFCTTKVRLRHVGEACYQNVPDHGPTNGNIAKSIPPLGI